MKFGFRYEKEAAAAGVCECVRQLAQPDVHSAASTLPINEQGLRVIAWRCCNEVDWINFVLTKISFLSWRRLFVPVQSSCAIFLWPLKAPAWYDFGACALEEVAKSSLVRNSILEKNWCLYEDPNSSNTDSRTHNELVTLLAVLKSYFSQIKGSSERISEARSNCCHLASQH